MQNLSYLEYTALAAICFAAAVFALALLSAPRFGSPNGISASGRVNLRNKIWIFDGDDLIDASASAKKLTGDVRRDYGWDQFREAFSAGYPTLPSSTAEIRRNLQTSAPSFALDDRSEFLCEWIDGLTHVELLSGPKRAEVLPDSRSALLASVHELETLRVAINNANYPVWRSDESGAVTWFNSAYKALFQQVKGTDPDQDEPLFGSLKKNTTVSDKKTRCSLSVSNSDRKLWFEVSFVRNHNGDLYYAIDINAVVDAEIAQRNFVQTLAKTFAQLSIGLAIFDRNRQLALFNPALIDLTALPADFLSARPTLVSFFDRLRDQNMMPEPKNYGSWREQMADLLAAATDGRYQETWSLPSGSVYSVNGRPHPDGAVAFLFEDITAEITLTRRFRSDLELGQSILDSLDDAIAVLSIDGSLTFSNASYQKLWNVDPERSFAQTAILDSVRVWQDMCKATPVWGDVREFVISQENRAEWWATVCLKSGEPLVCRVHPVQKGATLINFSRSKVLQRVDVEKNPVLSLD